jgi:hypothetical protein
MSNLTKGGEQLIDKFKTVSAVIFQFSILAIMTGCLYLGVGDTNTIIGALIGLAVGIGINTVKE